MADPRFGFGGLISTTQKVAIMGPGGLVTEAFIPLGATATQDNAGRSLLSAIDQLDQLSRAGAGGMPVVPGQASTPQQGRYEDVLYVVWPADDYARLAAAWASLGIYGSSYGPFDAGQRAADSMRTTAPGTYGVAYTTAFLRSAASVDALRSQLRANLRQAGVTGVPADPGSGSTSKFPWGWVLGTAALGLGLSIVLYTADRRSGEGAAKLSGAQRRKRALVPLLWKAWKVKTEIPGHTPPMIEEVLYVDAPDGRWEATASTIGTYRVIGPDPTKKQHNIYGDADDRVPEYPVGKALLRRAKSRAMETMTKLMTDGKLV